MCVKSHVNGIIIDIYKYFINLYRVRYIYICISIYRYTVYKYIYSHSPMKTPSAFSKIDHNSFENKYFSMKNCQILLVIAKMIGNKNVGTQIYLFLIFWGTFFKNVHD